jgi:hypothetical protein
MGRCCTGLYRHPPHQVIGQALPGVRLEGGALALGSLRWWPLDGLRVGPKFWAFSFSITSVATDLTCQ